MRLRLLFVLLAVLYLPGTALATTTTVASTTTTGVHYPSNQLITLRIYATGGNFVTSNSVQVLAGAVGSSQIYKTVSCSLSDTFILTIPSFTIDTTTDALVNAGNANYSAVLFSGNTQKDFWVVNFRVPQSQSPNTTWAEIIAYKSSPANKPAPLAYATTNYVDTVVRNSVTEQPDASTSVKGITKLSTAPDVATAPIAVGDNDPRMTDARTPTGAASGSLAGTYPNPTLSALATPGSCASCNLAINAEGRVTSYTDGSGGGGGAVTSVFNRTGIVTAQPNDYAWAQIDKTTSSIANITSRTIDLLASSTSANLASVLSDETGNGGGFVRANNATLVAPTLGVATATSVNGLTITTTTGTLSMANSKTLTVNNNLILSGTDGKELTLSGLLTIGADTSISGGGTLALAGFTGTVPATGTFAMGAGTLTVSSANSTSSATHTHAVTSSSNPGAAASLLASNGSGYLQLVRLGLGGTPSEALEVVGGNVFINSANANLYLKDTSTGFLSASSTVINPQNNNVIRSTTYTSGLVGWNIDAGGNAEFANLDVRGAIHSAIFTYNAINATAGTLGVFKSAAKLRTDVTIPSGPTYGSTTVNIDVVDAEGLSHGSSQLFVANDILRLKDGLVGDTWFKVSSASDQSTFWRYVAIIMAGSQSVTYRSGMGVADYGLSGQGFIIQTADQTNAPYLQMATHVATFSSNDSAGTLNVTPKLRLGNLNGSYGYAADTYGFGTGTYGVAGGSWVTVDSTNGVRIGNNTTTKISLDTSGNASFSGSITATTGSIGGWTINSTSISKNEVKIASSADVTGTAGTGEAWFGKSATGYYGLFLKGTTSAFLSTIAGNPAVSAAGRPYLTINDGTRYRVVIGELNSTLWDGVATNSMGMKVWSSAGVKLVEFSDVQNMIGGWLVGATSLTDIAGVVGFSNAVTGGDDIRIFAGNVTPASAPFRVTEAGVVTASSGTIGGWTLGASAFTAGSGATTVGLDVTVTGGDDIRIYAGDATKASAPFRVTEAGALTALNATITGSITSTSGTIGGWALSSTALTSGSGSTTVGLDSGGTNPALYAGSATPASAPFRVTNAGALTASNATITGVVTASSGSITGTVSISGASGALAIGSTPPASATSGTGIWIDRNQIATVNSNTQTSSISSSGIVGYGNSAFQAKNAASVPLTIATNSAGGGVTGAFEQINTNGTGTEARLSLQASGTDTSVTQIKMETGATGVGHQFRLYNDNFSILGVTIGADSAPVQMLDVRGRTLTIGAQWVTGSKPSCNSGNRGTVWYVAGGAGVLDTFEVCRKDAGDAYAWVSLF